MTDLAKFFRHIQKLNREPLTPEILEEIDFLITVSVALKSSLHSPQNIISIPQISSERIKSLAESYGFHILEGSSEQIYLSWAEEKLIDN